MSRKLQLVLVLSVLVSVPALADAATRWIAPTGNNGAAGTSAATAWRTWAFALAQLFPGDTLMVANGTYGTANGNGHPAINCGAGGGYRNGTSGSPITVKAENERQAHILGNGTLTEPFMIANCSYWIIEGLRVSNTVNVAGTGDIPNVRIHQSDHVTIRRFLIHDTNGHQIHGGLELFESTNSLIEENELYRFQQHGIRLFNNTSGNKNNVIRRNYVNAYNPPGPVFAPHHLYMYYPSSGNITENNIAEGFGGTGGAGYIIASVGPAHDNLFYGNIGLNTGQGMDQAPYFTVTGHYPINTSWTNMVIVDDGLASWTGYGINTSCRNCSFLGNTFGDNINQRHISPDYADPPLAGDGLTCTNCLTINAVGAGVSVSNYNNWLFTYVNSFGNGINYSPSLAGGGPHYANALSENPQLGTCKAWIPDSSPMKGRGQSGADIGANILYRYVNGDLTSERLWDLSSGAFPCGAVISGVNSSGNVCSNVHMRLNINQNGCAFPASYAEPPPVAVTRWIAPTGSNTTGTGTEANPWATFDFGTQQLAPGDTLIAKNGIYQPFQVICDILGGSVDGTALAPITVRAQNERQAKVSAIDTGVNQNPLFMQNCSYWTIEGLWFHYGDMPNPSAETDVVKISNSDHITFRRNITSHPNRWANGHGFNGDLTTDSLMEENEFYLGIRHGFLLRSNGPGRNVIRRNYVNSRMIQDIPGGKITDGPGSDLCMSTYSSPDNIFENNIVEGCNTGFASMTVSAQASRRNRFLGNITLGVPFTGTYTDDMNGGIGAGYSGASWFSNGVPTQYSLDEVIENHVVRYTGCTGLAVYGTNMQINNSSVVGYGAGNHPELGFACSTAVMSNNAGDQPPLAGSSAFFNNVLVMNNRESGPAFQITNTGSWTIDHPAVFNNLAGNFSPGTNVISPFTGNPQMGTCMAWIPDGSPLKGAGKGGTWPSGASADDIGANVLYRYHDGLLTTERLWDPSSGAFPCGAIAVGMNDQAGSSCADVHQRLNVNQNGCSFPASYAAPTPMGNVIKYRFEEGSGLIANDSSVAGNHGTLSSAGWGPGIVDNFSFNANAVRTVTTPGNAEIRPSSTFCMAAWLNGTTSANYTTIAKMSDDAYALVIEPNGRVHGFIVSGLSVYDLASAVGSNVLTGTNRHVVFSKDALGLQLWVDKISVGTIPAAVSMTYAGGNLIIGDLFPGRIDQFYLFDQPCGQAQVDNIYNELVPTLNVSMPHMRFYADAAEGQPISALDTNLPIQIGTPFGIRFAIENAGPPITEHFPLWCSRNGTGYVKVTNSFGGLGLRIETSTFVNMGDLTTVPLPNPNGLPLGAFTAIPGRFVADVISPTIRTTIPSGGHSEWEYRVRTGAPAVPTDTFVCQPRRENDSMFDSYANLKTITLEGAPAPALQLIGGHLSGGSIR